MKKFYSIIMITIFALIIAGCGGSKESSSSSGSKKDGEAKTIEFVLSTDYQEQSDTIKRLTDKFTEETGIKVKVTEIPNADMATKLKNMALSGDQPDVVKFTGVDPAFADQLLDISEVYKAHDFLPGFEITKGEEVIAAQIGLTAVGLYINEDLWTQAGVSYPTGDDDVWTWEEYEAKLQEVLAKTDAKYGMVFDKSEHRLKTFLYQWGVSQYNDDYTATPLASKKAVEAYEFFAKLNDDKMMPRSVWLSGEDPSAMFKTGLVAAYYSGSWQIPDFEKNIKDFKWKVVPMPYKESRATNYGGDYIFAFKDAGEEKETIQFLNWIFESDNYGQLAAEYGYIPIIKDQEVNYNTDAWDVFNSEVKASNDLGVHDKKKVTDYSNIDGVTVDNTIRDTIVQALNDEMSIKEAAQKIGDAYKNELDLEILK